MEDKPPLRRDSNLICLGGGANFLFASAAPAIGASLDRREKTQWVIRRGSPDDKRIVLVHVSTKGRNLLCRLTRAHKRNYDNSVPKRSNLCRTYVEEVSLCPVWPFEGFSDISCSIRTRSSSVIGRTPVLA